MIGFSGICQEEKQPLQGASKMPSVVADDLSGLEKGTMGVPDETNTGLQEVRLMRFEEAYGSWQEGRLTQGGAARLLGVYERTFQRHIDR
jgi:hypothetical protein